MTELEGLLRVALAALLGGAIGIERELAVKNAGLRTHSLVALGAALFTVIAVRLTDISYVNESIAQSDPARVIAGIVGGVGFLGAAVVFRDSKRPHGLTTAAGIWAVAGIGIAAGLGYYILAISVTILVLVELFVLKYIERWIGTRKD